MCPDLSSPVAMLINLLNARPDLITNDMVGELDFQLALLEVESAANQRSRDASYALYDARLNNPCTDIANKTEYENDPCSLLLLLSKTWRYLQSLNIDAAYLVAEYITDIITSTDERKPEKSVNGLKAWLEERHEVSLEKIDFDSDKEEVLVKNTLGLYVYFFPLYKETDGERVLKPFQSLRSFKATRNWTLTRENVPEMLSGLISYGYLNGKYLPRMDSTVTSTHLDNLESLVGVMWVESMRKYTKLSSTDEVLYLGNGIAFLDRMFDFVEDPCRTEAQLSKNFQCDKVGELTDPSCVAHCRTLGNFTAESRRLMAELMMMGMDTVNLPFNTFPLCGSSTGDYLTAESCWGRIINDGGVCYTSALGR